MDLGDTNLHTASSQTLPEHADALPMGPITGTHTAHSLASFEGDPKFVRDSESYLVDSEDKGFPDSPV
jgi:hypothetical protein